MKQKITISVIGGHEIDEKVEKLAYKVGSFIAQVGAVLVCGGLDGVMSAAARGAKESGGDHRTFTGERKKRREPLY